MTPPCSHYRTDKRVSITIHSINGLYHYYIGFAVMSIDVEETLEDTDKSYDHNIPAAHNGQ